MVIKNWWALCGEIGNKYASCAAAAAPERWFLWLPPPGKAPKWWWKSAPSGKSNEGLCGDLSGLKRPGIPSFPKKPSPNANTYTNVCAYINDGFVGHTATAPVAVLMLLGVCVALSNWKMEE